jgi:hypothetical protein
MTQADTVYKISEEILHNNLASKVQIEVIRAYLEQAFAVGYDFGRTLERAIKDKASVAYL